LKGTSAKEEWRDIFIARCLQYAIEGINVSANGTAPQDSNITILPQAEATEDLVFVLK
jgi:hypothetical protein